MRISRIAIENYRNFRNLVIDPFPASAVIVGENGVGKSNLLRAIRLVLDPDLPDSARKLRKEDISEYSAVTWEDGATVRIEIDLTDFDGYRNAESALDGCITSFSPLTARIVYIFKPLVGATPGQLTREDYGFEIVGGAQERKDAKYLRRDIAYTVLPALRDAVGDLSRWRDSPLQDLLDARPPQRSALEAAADKISTAMDSLAASDELRRISSDLTNRLTKMAGPRMDTVPTFGFASSDPDKLLRSLRLFVDQSRNRSIGDTSTGAANVIYLALLLERLQSKQDTDSVLQPLLAVEEPEAHLHPVLQRQIFSYLLHSEPSLMVTTHSPHIAAVAQLDSLVLLRKSNAGDTVPSYTAGVGFQGAVRQDLERYLDVSRAEILFCSAVILVEGTAETYLIPEIARSFGFDLDLYGVIVVSVAGTDFAPYRTLLGVASLNIPHVIITDGDPTNKKGEYIHFGPKRAAKLQDAARPRGAVEEVEKLAALGEGFNTAPFRAQATEDDIFIGPKTLEVDVVGLLSDELIAAHNELDVSLKLQAQMRQAVQAIKDGTGGAQEEQELLRRINYVSKGRYAQRLAAHMRAKDWSADVSRLTAVVSTVPTLEVTTSDGNSTLKLDDEKMILRLLLAHAPYGYVLSAIDRISRIVRHRGLFDTAGEV
ncbi:ATP-dependent nuclease [Streptomyces sp. NPDC055886]